MSDKEQENNKGWQCPVCEKVYSPDVKSCEECSKAKTVKEVANESKKQLLKG